MFTSEKRVIRDGYLVAFEGEVMTDDEAARRGLVKAKATRIRAKKADEAAVADDAAEPVADKPKAVRARAKKAEEGEG